MKLTYLKISVNNKGVNSEYNITPFTYAKDRKIIIPTEMYAQRHGRK